jgi:hypothetical protein
LHGRVELVRGNSGDAEPKRRRPSPGQWLAPHDPRTVIHQQCCGEQSDYAEAEHNDQVVLDLTGVAG